MKPKKIAIIGIGGVGKSYLARRLSKKLSLPVIHMDTHIWSDGWVETDLKKVEKQVKAKLTQDHWIIEGYIFPCDQLRLQKSDVVYYLDYPGWRAALGGLKRWWRYKGKKREEMVVGCEEGHKIPWDYLKVLWKRLERPEIEKALKKFGKRKKIIRLMAPRETEKRIKGLSEAVFL